MRRHLGSAILAFATVFPAMADDSARIKELEKRLEELDQKYRVLERRLEIEQEAATEKAKTAPSMSIGAQGFSYRSADTNFVLRIRGLLQADSRFYIDDGNNNRNDSFLVRRARPIIEGTLWDSIDFALVPDFGGTGTVDATGTTVSGPSARILDAFANFRYSPELQLRVGKFKTPVGLEQLQSDASAFFMERGMSSYLTPNRDVGVMVHGDVAGGLFHYAAGVFNGGADNRDSTGVDFDDEKDVAARVFAHPFVKTDLEVLQGLGLGFAGSYGNQDGGFGLAGYQTEAGQTFFGYRTGAADLVRADGEQYRWTPQGYYYYRSFGLLAEYVASSHEVRNAAGARAELEHKAWQVVGGYVLTGEDASYRGVTPKKPFSLTNGQWGAFELVARYSNLDIDDAAFPTFATAASASEAQAYGVGLNWYANRNIRTSLNFIHTDFESGAATGVTAQDENAILTRLQLSF